ncbi:MAG: hypothetical protein ACLFSY_10165 [Desulfonatronovibrionaceae bacterium]
MFKKLIAVAALGLAVTGCSHMESNVEQRVEPHLNHIDIYQPPPVELSRPQVHVRPQFPSPPRVKAVMFPFWLRGEAANKRDLGRGMGRIVWETWREMEILDTLSYKSRTGWPGRREAREIALREGAQMYVLGQITNYLPGGSQGSTSVALRLDIYSAREDSLLWSMQQSGRIDPRPDMDFVLFKRKNWMPDSPVYVIVKSLASRLGAEVYGWTHPEALQREK